MSTTVKHDSGTILGMLDEMEKILEVRKRANALGAPTPKPASSPQKSKITHAAQRGRAKRVRFDARVLMVKNQRYLKGAVLNISRTGLFVVTHERVFQENEAIRVVIRPKGSSRSYKIVARVVRFEARLGCPHGYGLRFVRPKILSRHRQR